MGLIRIILAISVVTAHTGNFFGLSFVGGEMAVKLFFMISGFYMCLILNEKYVGHPKAIRLFYKNRLLRLYPLYFLILICSVVVTVLGSSSRPELASPVTVWLTNGIEFSPASWIYFIFVNGTMLGMDSSLFLGLDLHSGGLFFTSHFADFSPRVHEFLFVPQSWSISLELIFYFVAPFIVKNPKRLLILFVGFLIPTIWIAFSDLPSDPWNSRFFPTQMPFFLLGSIGYYVYVRFEKLSDLVKRNIGVLCLIVTLSLTLFYLDLCKYFPQQYLFALIVMVYFIGVPSIFCLTKNWKKDRFVGELSYSVYMIHLLALYGIKLIGISSISVFGTAELTVFASIVASALIQKIFLDKVERFRKFTT